MSRQNAPDRDTAGTLRRKNDTGTPAADAGKAHLSINEWAEADRPREKLAALGAQALSDAELLAILIGSGSSDESAVALMRRVLDDCGRNLNTLGKRSIDDLCRYKGVGAAKAITILAACELGKRRQAAEAGDRPKMDCSRRIYEYFLPRMQDLPHEECHVLLLNNALRVIASRCVSRGGITGTAVDVRLVLREALLARATAMALCHNHPSGNARPSRQDDELTRRMAAAAGAVEIRFVDHIVLADGSFFSYSDEGKF